MKDSKYEYFEMWKKIDITSNFIPDYAIYKTSQFLQQIKLTKAVLKMNETKLNNCTKFYNSSLISFMRRLGYFPYFTIEY